MATKVDENKAREIVQNMKENNQVNNTLPLQPENDSVLASVKDCRDGINRESNFIMSRVSGSE